MHAATKRKKGNFYLTRARVEIQFPPRTGRLGRISTTLKRGSRNAEMATIQQEDLLESVANALQGSVAKFVHEDLLE
jgi:hypothetical protein